MKTADLNIRSPIVVPMDTKILKEIGLTDSESKVYMAILELKDSTRGDIVNKSKISGSKIYELLEKLQEKGLISIYLKDNIKHFKATNPKQILNYIDEKKQKIIQTEKEATLLLPELLSIYNISNESQEVELLTGLKGMQIIFEEQIDIMNKGETCYVIGGTKGSNEQTILDFFEKIHLLREQKNIHTKMLFNSRQKKTTKEIYSSKKYPLTKTKFISSTSPVAINIYKNRTIIIIFGNQISAIQIKSQEVANSFLEYFNLLWKTAEN